jgi:hypothetical protein
MRYTRLYLQGALSEDGLIVLAGAVSSALGLLGGAVGTYYSVKNAKDGRERATYLGVAFAAYALVTLAATSLLLTRPPYRQWVTLAWLTVGLPAALLASAWLRRRMNGGQVGGRA